MSQFPSNWSQAESEYYENFDPLADKCPYCKSEHLNSLEDEKMVCVECGHLFVTEAFNA